MFGFGRHRKLIQEAQCLGRTMVRLRAMSDGKDFDAFAEWLSGDGYIKYGEHKDRHERSLAFLATPTNDPDIVFTVKEIASDFDPGYLHLFATGYHRLFGLMLMDNVRGADVCVDVDEIAARMNELGSDTIAMRNALLGFPGFSSLGSTLDRFSGR